MLFLLQSIVQLTVLVLLSCYSVNSQPPPPGDSGTSSQNVHVTFGDNPDGGVDYSIDYSIVTASISSFSTMSVNYYGAWWNANVGTDTAVASDFCAAGNPATATVETFSPMTVTDGTSDWTGSAYSVPSHDVEDYCSAAGGITPPLMETTFDTAYTMIFSKSPSTDVRVDISNNVGWAVNGVYIFSPFTGIGTVAPEDETLDTCVGHPANGQYHYHGYAPCLFPDDDGSAHSPIYGWAYDGFPIYGPWGYNDGTDSSSDIVTIQGGYSLTDSAADATDPLNWVYGASTGHLDDCNGRYTVTPEFPDGIYAYVLNIDAEGAIEFPGVPYCYQEASSTSDPLDSDLNDAVEIGTYTSQGVSFTAYDVSADTSSTVTATSDVLEVTTTSTVVVVADTLPSATDEGAEFSFTLVSGTGDAVIPMLLLEDDCGNTAQYIVRNELVADRNVKGWLYTCDFVYGSCVLDDKVCDSPIGTTPDPSSAFTIGLWATNDSSGTITVEHESSSGIVSYTASYLQASTVQVTGYGFMVVGSGNEVVVSAELVGTSATPSNSYPGSGACATADNPVGECAPADDDTGNSPSSSATMHASFALMAFFALLMILN